MCVKIISYACTVQNIFIPDQSGTIRDVVLGYDTLEGYETGSSFFGAFVGRYANRIKNAEFGIRVVGAGWERVSATARVVFIIYVCEQQVMALKYK